MTQEFEYDLREAKRLIIDHLAKNVANPRGRFEAAEAIVKNLVRLDGIGGLRIRWESITDCILFGINRQLIRVAADDGEVYIRPDGGESVRVPLDFNAETCCLEGAEDDAFVTPTPGAPTPRRSAVAVIVEQVLSALESSDGQ